MKVVRHLHRYTAFGLVLFSLFLLLSGCNGEEECSLEVTTLSPAKAILYPGETTNVTVGVRDCGTAVTYIWQTDNGAVNPSGETNRSTITYTAPDFTGKDTISVKVTDSEGRSVEKTVEMSVVVPPTLTNTPPVITPTPTIAPTPVQTSTSTPEPENIVVGPVCLASEDKDPNTLYLRQADFQNLNLLHQQAGVKISVYLAETGKTQQNITLDLGTQSPLCAVEMSPDLLAPLGIIADVTLEVADRPERQFTIAEMPIEIEIANPFDGEIVSGRIYDDAQGTYANLPPDRELWLVVLVGSNYFAQRGPAILIDEVNWQYGTIYFGNEDSGTGKYTLLAVLAAPQAVMEFQNHLDGSALGSQLPPGAIIYDRVEVVR